jgi:carbonic anhydrase
MPQLTLDGYRNFRRSYFNEREYLKSLAAGQSPRALVIACCDSRVVPEIITGSGLGDIFTLRNIANFVPGAREGIGASVGAAVEYAINHLSVPDVIVCGHTQCGGVEAAMGDIAPLRGEPSLYEWLSHVALAVRSPARQGITGAAGFRAAVECNVLAGLANLVTYRAVSDALDAGKIHLHGWGSDIATLGLSAFDADSGRFEPVQSLSR